MKSPIIVIDGTNIVKNKIAAWRRFKYLPDSRPLLIVGLVGGTQLEFVAGNCNQSEEEIEAKYLELESKLIEAVREGEVKWGH